jgi:transglutaminase-like putative cysteine protease
MQMEYPDMLPIRFVWSAALVCGVLILITATLPGNVTVERASQTWSTLSAPFKAARARWEDLFSTINAPPGAGSGSFALRSAALGGSRQLSDAPVMEVRSIEYDYWRAMAMDRYDGGGWQNTIGEQARSTLGASAPEQARTPLEPEQPIPVFDVAGRREVSQVFTLAADREDDLVFVGGTAAKISLPTAVEHNYVVGEAGATPNFDDSALIVAREPLRAGDTYTVTALVSRVDVATLSVASADYPAWVRERYLQLPDTISQRTRDLAARIVADAGATTPYDQAIAIQDYLRSFVYTESIPNPPAGQDQVDWFLFDQRAGYCDYFASSMVVMLRAQGIPARWVRGFAGGEFDAERGVYVVKENLAHTWPEVYFPDVGWERFEPTPASYTTLPQRPLTAAFGADPSEGGLAGAGPFPDPGRFEDLEGGLEVQERGAGALQPIPAQERGPWPGILGGLLAALALGAAAVYGRWRYELRGLSRVGQSYAGMELLASWGGRGQPAHATPQEYAEQLSRELPAHGATIRQIAAAYQSERYRRGRRADLPTEEEERDLRRSLARRIFTGLAERMPQPRERRG